MQQKNAEKIKELFTKSTRSDTMQTKENVFLFWHISTLYQKKGDTRYAGYIKKEES